MHAEPPATWPNTSAVATEAILQTHPIDRRRPGRAAYINAHLIALLRRHAPADPVETPDANAAANARRLVCGFPKPAFVDLPTAKPTSEAPQGQGEEPDQLAAARGIGIGVLIAIPLWAGIVALGWWIIDR